ncbi:TPA: hypothetical protein ACGQAU_004302 [Escherichia coli]
MNSNAFFLRGQTVFLVTFFRMLWIMTSLLLSFNQSSVQKVENWQGGEVLARRIRPGLDLKIIAERIETQKQARVMTDKGIH